MNRKQKKFAEIYAQSGNATQSAIQAGYSAKFAHTNAVKLLHNTAVAEYIRQLSEAEQDKRILSAKERKAMLSDIARDTCEATKNRIKAIDSLNKMTGEYITRLSAEVKPSEKFSDILAQIGGEGLDE